MQGQQESYHQPERSTRENSAPWVVSHGQLSRIRQEVEGLNDNLDLQGIYTKLIGFIKSGHREVTDSSMVCLALLFRKGHSSEFIKCQNAANSLVKYFNMLSRELQALDCIDEQPTQASKVQGRLLGVLSLIAQLLHDNPSWSLPLTKRFTLNMFMLNPELVAASPLKSEIIKVLSVIWLAISREIKFLKETSLLSRFKQLLLESYQLAHDSRILMRLNSALRNIIKESPLTIQQARNYELVSIMTRFLTSDQLKQVNSVFKLKSVSEVQTKNQIGSK